MGVHFVFLVFLLTFTFVNAYDPNDTELSSVIPPKGTFEAFYLRGEEIGSSRAAHSHGSFYKHRNPALVDAKNSPAYGFRFDGGRRKIEKLSVGVVAVGDIEGEREIYCGIKNKVIETSTTKMSSENPTNWKEATSIYEFTANNINGEPVSLEKYKGHVCIIVNVASKCGHTKSNYEQFVKIYDEYSESNGLRILAFPCNQFGAQEPGDSEKICKFVEARNVKFDMFEKVNVNGPKAHPLWNYLKEKLPAEKGGKTIKWNFTKFIIDQEGQPVERFPSATKPLTLVDTLKKYW